MSRLLDAPISTSIYSRDLAISAVSYDSMLVTELTEQLAPRLDGTPFWSGGIPSLNETPDPFLIESSARLVLVLFQRLWQHDHSTQADAMALRARMQSEPDSVRLVVLDAEPVPEWLSAVPRCSLSAIGLEGVADFTVHAIGERGGMARPAPPPPPPPPAEPGDKRWFDSPPFLTQRRAIATLRHELDALGAELEPRVKREQERFPDSIVQLHSLPFRFLAQLGSVGLTFSWVASGLGNVADGRLLVIEWTGLLPKAKGMLALKSASQTRERIYRPEAAGPSTWKWRAEDPNGRAYSTVNLVREWLVGATLAVGV